MCEDCYKVFSNGDIKVDIKRKKKKKLTYLCNQKLLIFSRDIFNFVNFVEIILKYLSYERRIEYSRSSRLSYDR